MLQLIVVLARFLLRFGHLQLSGFSNSNPNNKKSMLINKKFLDTNATKRVI